MFDVIEPLELLYYGSSALMGFSVLYGLFRESSKDRTLVQVTCRGVHYGRGSSLNDALFSWLGAAHQSIEEAMTLELTFQRGEEVLAYPVRFEPVEGDGQWRLTVVFDEQTRRTLYYCVGC